MERISLEAIINLTAAIHSAAAYPERWPEALSAVANLVDSSGPESLRHDRGWENVLASLDRLGVAAFIVNANGIVYRQNACAGELLASSPAVRATGSRLRFSDRIVCAKLEGALRKATQAAPRSSLFQLRPSASEVNEVNVSPLEPASAPDANETPPLALVVIARTRPDSQERIARRVRQLYGLTEAEAGVMAALTLGQTVERIAVAHGVCISTVRAQVRSIFEKTGIHRQTDLVRLALSSPPLAPRAER